MATKTFQKKPETINAVQWVDTASYWDICTFLGMELTYIGAQKLLEIPMGNGTYAHAQQNDWIVKDATGTIYIYHPDVITNEYDDITAASTPASPDPTTGGTPSA